MRLTGAGKVKVEKALCACQDFTLTPRGQNGELKIL